MNSPSSTRPAAAYRLLHFRGLVLLLLQARHALHLQRSAQLQRAARPHRHGPPGPRPRPKGSAKQDVPHHGHHKDTSTTLLRCRLLPRGSTPTRTGCRDYLRNSDRTVASTTAPPPCQAATLAGDCPPNHDHGRGHGACEDTTAATSHTSGGGTPKEHDVPDEGSRRDDRRPRVLARVAPGGARCNAKERWQETTATHTPDRAREPPHTPGGSTRERGRTRQRACPLPTHLPRSPSRAGRRRRIRQLRRSNATHAGVGVGGRQAAHRRQRRMAAHRSALMVGLRSAQGRRPQR